MGVAREISQDFLRAAVRRQTPGRPLLNTSLAVPVTTLSTPERNANAGIAYLFRPPGVVPADADLDMLMDMLSGVVVYRLLFQPEERDPTTVQE
jgi:hypothetical protein